jgi:membrane protein YqaA with SNARE-associated domain
MDFTGWIDAWGLWGLFGAAFLSATLLPGGSELAAAALALDGTHGAAAIVAVATLGNTLGGLTSVALGRWLAWRFPGTLPTRPDQRRALAWLRRRGSPLLLLAWLPVVGDPLCVAAGWLRIGWLPATLFIALGKGARYLLVVGLAA